MYVSEEQSCNGLCVGVKPSNWFSIPTGPFLNPHHHPLQGEGESVIEKDRFFGSDHHACSCRVVCQTHRQLQLLPMNTFSQVSLTTQGKQPQLSIGGEPCALPPHLTSMRSSFKETPRLSTSFGLRQLERWNEAGEPLVMAPRASVTKRRVHCKSFIYLVLFFWSSVFSLSMYRGGLYWALSIVIVSLFFYHWAVLLSSHHQEAKVRRQKPGNLLQVLHDLRHRLYIHHNDIKRSLARGPDAKLFNRHHRGEKNEAQRTHLSMQWR